MLTVNMRREREVRGVLVSWKHRYLDDEDMMEVLLCLLLEAIPVKNLIS